VISTAPDESRWARAGLAVLLAPTAVFWLIGLGRNEWANSFYSGAVQAGSRSWKAALFGASDAAGSITVDKPPASLWPMELSVRLFGLSSWSILVPQVLIGVATVALLYATVRRTLGSGAGLIAGGVLALTPVATLMFRYNNPDALLVFLMVAAAWALLRAVDDGQTRWLLTCGAFLGLGFLTKQLQVMLVVPAMAGSYLVAGPPRLAIRVGQLLAALAAMAVAGGWWVVLVSLTPAADRPYIGGSTDNSFLNLTFGYNGLSRLTGHHAAGFPAPQHAWSRSHAGVARLFTGESAMQISWLLPAALILMVAGLLWCRHTQRTDARRAQYVLWGGWLVVGGVVFSAMSGTYHDYYTVALAPAIAALVALGATDAWLRRESPGGRRVLAGTVAVTAVWACAVLSRVPGFVSPLRWIVLAMGLLAAAALLLRPRPAVAVLGGVACLTAPLALSIQTISTSHHGGIVNAGPSLPGADKPGEGPGNWAGMQSTAVSPELARILSADAGSYTWVAAMISANKAASYQIATGFPVMPIGGFLGRDPSPTLAQFQRDVAGHRIHYFIDNPRLDKDEEETKSKPGESDHIVEWVKEAFVARTIDGVTIHDLTVAK
jgi:hypothetical protein